MLYRFLVWYGTWILRLEREAEHSPLQWQERQQLRQDIEEWKRKAL